MATARIEALDLRDPLTAKTLAVIERRHYDEMMEGRALDRQWNWPHFPERVVQFIETGVIPAKSRNFEIAIHVSTREFHRGMARAQKKIMEAMLNLGKNAWVYEHKVYPLSRWQRFLIYFGLAHCR